MVKNSQKNHSPCPNVLIFLIVIFIAASCDIQDSNPVNYPPIINSQIISSSAQISNITPQDDHPSTLDKWQSQVLDGWLT